MPFRDGQDNLKLLGIVRDQTIIYPAKFQLKIFKYLTVIGVLCKTPILYDMYANRGGQTNLELLGIVEGNYGISGKVSTQIS